MHSNVMTQDRDIVEDNEGLYGTNRINYYPIALGLAGREEPHDVGSLVERSHVTISYDVAQKFPDDDLAAALKPTATELAQVHGVSADFKYCQYSKGVEFKLSSMQDVNPANIEAGINKELWKEWDHMVMNGEGNNEGFLGHSKGHAKTPAGSVAYATLVSETQASIGRIKSATDITSDEYNLITMLHDDAITSVLDTYAGTSDVTNREKFLRQFPGLVLVEAPANIMPSAAPGKFLMVVRDMVTLHRASVPALYAREPGKYGLSQDSLFTYESAGVELEVDGAIQETTWIGV